VPHVRRQRQIPPGVALLHEDAALLAVAKPSGLPSHATPDPFRDHLTAAVARLLSQRDGTAGYLGLVHRLDADTSGLVLFARSEAGMRALSAAFQQRTVQKTYLALALSPTNGSVQAGLVRNHLRDFGKGDRPVRAVRSGGDRAETALDFPVQSERGVLVVAQPKTGRRHQIRVHLADLGLPILGDRLYGDETAAPRLMLHAWRLAFPHPDTGLVLHLACLPPADFVARAHQLGLDLAALDNTTVNPR
jgi:23S rRNA pseudouridine955/2504/2580 synthase/23S rRNA pseudouridine1911/1915/1917 synthase